MKFYSSLCGISLFVVVLANEYCFRYLCLEGQPHIACGHTGNFATSCPSDARLIDMEPYKEILVHAHNEKRNAIANGIVPGFARAARMATMKWDDDLAALATMNVLSCRMMHDCHHTETYQYSGQSLFKQETDRRRDPDNQVMAAIEMWWSQHTDCTMNYIKNFTFPTTKVGQFTCLVSELNTAVGCAIATFTSCRRHVFLLTCNYANCNVYGKPIYVSGRTASRCTTGVNPDYRGLCSEDEEFDINFDYSY